MTIYMKNISDITDPGASFNTELQKDISNSPLNLQQNDQCALEVHRITVAMELKSSKSDSSLGIDTQRFNSATWIVLENQPGLWHHGETEKCRVQEYTYLFIQYYRLSIFKKMY